MHSNWSPHIGGTIICTAIYLDSVRAHVLPRQDSLEPDAGASSQLPLTPEITPAVAIAGILLIATGLVLAVIGIKYRRLHIFLSMAYLASLSITVIIEYAIDYPVSDAIQGALLVAACVGGAIAGGIAVLFKDIDECSACLLGGFCFSMWLMTLRSGGLIRSEPGKVIFIVALSALSCAMFFIRIIRNYALITGIVFSGATATMLGIDCFTRAGLKEFWIIIWNANEKTFPSGPSFSYPMTKGIRIEIGCTILIFVCGLIYQFRLWRAEKQRRDSTAAQWLQQRRDSEKLEAAISRQAYENSTKPRATWDTTFADSEARRLAKPDFGLGFPMPCHLKSPTRVFTTELGNTIPNRGDSVDTMPSIKTSDGQSHVIIRTASNDGLQRTTASPESTRVMGLAARTSRTEDAEDGERRLSSPLDYPSLSPTSRPPPPVFSLPFQSQTQEMGDGDLTYQNDNCADERDSSVIRTTDFSPDPSQKAVLEETITLSSSRNYLDKYPQIEYSMTEGDIQTGERNEKIKPHREHESTQDVVEFEGMIPGGTRICVNPGMNHPVIDGQKDYTRNNNSTSLPSANQDLEVATEMTTAKCSALVDSLPQPMSKIATSYRTDEWAKHLEEADLPDLDHDIPHRSEPLGVQMESRGVDSYHSLGSESNLTWIGFDHTTDVEKGEWQHEKIRSAQSPSTPVSSRSSVEQSVAPPLNSQSALDTRCLPTLATGTSLALLKTRRGDDRIQKLKMSLPALNTTLLGQRQSILSSRHPSTSSTLNYTHPSVSSPGPSTPTSHHTQGPLDTSLADDMTLSQRRNELLKWKVQSPQHQRISSTAQSVSSLPSAPQTPTPQPRRQSSTPYTSPLLSYPQTPPRPRHISLQLPPAPSVPDQAARQRYLRHTWQHSTSNAAPTAPQIDERRRAAMMLDRDDARERTLRRESEQRSRERRVSELMKSGDEMNELHREKMRQMQSQARRNTGIS